MFTAGIGGREFEDVFISSWATGCMSPVVKVVFCFFFVFGGDLLRVYLGELFFLYTASSTCRLYGYFLRFLWHCLYS